MKLHSLLLGAIALPLATVASAGASQPSPESYTLPAQTSTMLPMAEEMAGAASEPVIQLAQANDPRVVGLEEQVRQLNGRIEEMNFQILQIQEQMRKMQEDVDFRLQEMEQKRGDAGSAGGEPKRANNETETAPATAEAPRQAAEAPASSTSVPEKPLGTLVVDGQGNVTGGTMEPDATVGTEATSGADAGTDDQKVAALPSTDDPSQLYKDSYEYVLSGDYGTAEAGFRQHIDKFPNDPQSADARYWLGEALLGQQRYRDAAEVFVDANRQFPDSRKSPDMLLKLGVSLSALNQRDVACATFEKIGQRYPKASSSLKERVKQERALAGC